MQGQEKDMGNRGNGWRGRDEAAPDPSSKRSPERERVPVFLKKR